MLALEDGPLIFTLAATAGMFGILGWGLGIGFHSQAILQGKTRFAVRPEVMTPPTPDPFRRLDAIEGMLPDITPEEASHIVHMLHAATDDVRDATILSFTQLFGFPADGGEPNAEPEPSPAPQRRSPARVYGRVGRQLDL